MNGRNMNVKLLKNKADSVRRAAACVAALLLVAATVSSGPQAASSTPQNMQRLAELKGTINAVGRLIAIAQASSGHVILDATWAIPPDGSMPTIMGRHILELNDGTMHEGTFSMT